MGNGVQRVTVAKLCIVVADDQEHERAQAVEPLRAAGHEVLEATNGAEAVDLVRAGGVDMVVLDAYMPRVNGFLAVKTILEEKTSPPPPMLLLIPNATPKEAAMASRLGANGYLPKPVNARDLVNKVLTLSRGVPVATHAGAASPRAGAGMSEGRLREEIVKRIDQLPSLPSVVHELMQALGDESARIEDLGEVICRDQGLAARILKLVNSSFFRSQREIATISEAIMRLGRNTIQSLALASTTSVAFTLDSPQYGYVEGGLWLHSFSVAVAARRYSSVRHAAQADQAFLGGLLHDVGKLVVGGMINKQAAEFVAARTETGAVTLAEKKLCSRDHAEVGDMIGERWKFPDRIRELIRGHHRPVTELLADPMCCAVVLADLTCNRLRLGMTPLPEVHVHMSPEEAAVAPPPPPYQPTPDEEALLRVLGINPELALTIEVETRQSAKDYEDHFAS